MKVKVKFTQLCLILCNSKDYTVHGIIQARILEWLAFPFLQGIFPNPEVEPRSPALQADSLQTEDDIKIKSFYTAKEISKVKRQPMGWGKY